MPQHYHPFLSGETYHVYNHANGDEDIFREEDNYRYFIEKYKKYIAPVADTLAYCLMKNHFHMMVRINDVEFFRHNQPFKGLGIEEAICKYISLQFSHLFNSYTQAYNKKYNRNGSLFIPRVKRKQIMNDNYFSDLIVYIHNNPVHHGFVADISDWGHSSYRGILRENDQIVDVNEILGWFGSLRVFVDAHKDGNGLTSVFD